VLGFTFGNKLIDYCNRICKVLTGSVSTLQSGKRIFFSF
jgi:hypothetical protein